LFGRERAERGSRLVDGAPARLRSPRDAIRRGLGLCPEDRQVEGLVPELSVAENLLLALQARRGWLRRLSRRRRRELAERLVRALEIAVADLDAPVSRLSGGNQQKVLLARWLATRPRLLLLDEPTRGIDVGARAEIERWIAGLREEGTAAVLVSSEPDELTRLSQAVVVLRDGRSVARLRGEGLGTSALLREL
jgi:simple sugar transport system ATP-binding protein